jgi:predicted house-cleaning noncanonical NTP pyrophosphatase (MazG superfamily)
MTAEEFRDEIEQALKRHVVDTDPDAMEECLNDALEVVDQQRGVEL